MRLNELAGAADSPPSLTPSTVLGVSRSTWWRWRASEEEATDLQRAAARVGARDWARAFGAWLHRLDQVTGGPDVWGSLLDAVTWGYQDAAGDRQAVRVVR
jgi:hypothetical protein